MSTVIQERGFGSLPSSTKANPTDQVKSISNTAEADSYPIRHIRSSQYAVSTGQNRASVSGMPLSTYLNLGLGELAHTKLTVELADRIVKYPKGIAENVLVGDDLMPAIEKGEVIEEFRTRDDKLDTGIRFEFTHTNFFPLLYVNVMSKKFHNSIMKDKMVYKGNNVGNLSFKKLDD
ncbi:hypothetical protein Tco_1046419 [Tanacetum coccineum]